MTDWNFFNRTQSNVDIDKKIEERSNEVTRSTLAVAPEIFNVADTFRKGELPEDQLETRAVTLTLPKKVWEALEASTNALFYKGNPEYEEFLPPDLREVRNNLESQAASYERSKLEVAMGSFMYVEMLKTIDQIIYTTAKSIAQEAMDKNDSKLLADVQRWERKMVGKPLDDDAVAKNEELTAKLMELKDKIETAVRNGEEVDEVFSLDDEEDDEPLINWASRTTTLPNLKRYSFQVNENDTSHGE